MTPDPRIAAREAELRARFPRAFAQKEQTTVPGYRVQYYASWVVVLLLAATGAIQLAGPTDLGISPVMFRWIGILASVLGVAQGFLPSVRRPPTDRDDAGPASDPDPMPRNT